QATQAKAAAAPLSMDESMPPWTDTGDVPFPNWTRSVTPNRPEAAIYSEPGKIEARRGSAQVGARLPLYGTRRGAGCMGRWLNVGPLAWMCSDVADFSGEDPWSPLLGTRPWSISSSSSSSGGEHVEDVSRPIRPGAAHALPPIEPSSTTD